MKIYSKKRNENNNKNEMKIIINENSVVFNFNSIFYYIRIFGLEKLYFFGSYLMFSLGIAMFLFKRIARRYLIY
jgi:hypothetical protein